MAVLTWDAVGYHFFETGTKNGVPVPAELTIPINFKLFKKNGYYDIETDDNGIEKTTVRERKKKSKWWKGN